MERTESRSADDKIARRGQEPDINRKEEEDHWSEPPRIDTHIKDSVPFQWGTCLHEWLAKKDTDANCKAGRQEPAPGWSL